MASEEVIVAVIKEVGHVGQAINRAECFYFISSHTGLYNQKNKKELNCLLHF